MSESALVRLEEIEPNGVFELTMTATDRRNVLSVAMVAGLVDGFATATAQGCRALILRAEAGVRTWSAGFAIDELPADPQQAWPHPMAPVTAAIRSAPFAVIASVEGGAWGGACEVAFACDLVVAEEQATFALTPARLGVAYDADALRALGVRVPGHVLSELVMTAAPVGAIRMAELGIVNRVTEGTSGLEAASRGLATQVAANAPLTIAAAKSVIQGLDESTIARRSDAAWASQDYREGLSAFAQRRQPEFTGH